MSTRASLHDVPRHGRDERGTRSNPDLQMYGRDGTGAWWVYPVVLTLVTLVLIVAAAVIQGPGADSASAAAGQGTATPAVAPSRTP